MYFSLLRTCTYTSASSPTSAAIFKAELICRADKHPQAMRHCLTCGSSPEKGMASEARRASEVLQLWVEGTHTYKVPQECYVL